MRKMRKLLAIVLSITVALTMGIAMTSLSFAAETGTITITPPTGVDASASNSYKIYKVFDAVASGDNISYKLVSGKTTAPAGFTVDNAGNVSYTGSGEEGQLTDADIAAIAAYVTEADLVDTATSTGSANAVSKALPNGYYYITTSTGSVVTIDSTKPTANVIDKNTVPSVNKEITGANSVDADGKKALAQVGTDVTYTADVTVGKGAKGYIFHDTMETGLTYNNDVKVYIGETEVAATNYEVNKDGDKLAADTFSVSFKDDYIKTLAVGTVLKVVYSAKVNNDAITTDPLNNTCYVSYGDKNSNNKTPNSDADVYEAKFTVTKNQPAKEGEAGAVLNESDHKYYKPLSGAGFVIKNGAGKYYKIENNVVTWVDSINDATEYTSNAQGQVQSFTGLANGTYTLVEKTVPEGYNTAADQTFTVSEGNYTAANLEQATTVTNNGGAELPSTGGIGTTIFYILGALLVIGCGIVLVARRRMTAK